MVASAAATTCLLELLDDVENELNIHCVPITWPIGCGKEFRGVYHFSEKRIYLYESGRGNKLHEVQYIDGIIENKRALLAPENSAESVSSGASPLF